MANPEEAQLQIPLTAGDRLNGHLTYHIAGIVTALSAEADIASERQYAFQQDPLTNSLQELLAQNVIKACKLHFELVKVWTNRTAEGIEQRDSAREYIPHKTIETAALDTFSAEKMGQSAENVDKRAEVYLGILDLTRK